MLVLSTINRQDRTTSSGETLRGPATDVCDGSDSTKLGASTMSPLSPRQRRESDFQKKSGRAKRSQSFRLCARKLNYFGPLVRFLYNEFPEIGRRSHQHAAT